jgi:hypothetical protein
MHARSLRHSLLATLILATFAGCASKEPADDSAAAAAPVAKAAVVPTTPPPPQSPPINPVINNCNVTTPDTPVTPALLTSGTPCQPQFVPPFDLDNLQHGFDYYSWLTFIALNAPEDGQAPAPGNDGDTQWEEWREVSDLMLPGGARPGGFDAPRVVPDACKGLDSAGTLRVIQRSGLNKAGTHPIEVTSEVTQPFDSGPLIDQNGNFVRYEILVNEPMYEYIVQNDLYSKIGQQAFDGPVVFPEGNNNTASASSGTMGAIMVKAAWKVMGAGDDQSKFHITQALAYNPPSVNPRIPESCSKVTLGLVGWHAAHKTDDAPQWIWSTYEHVDNVPSDADIKAGKLKPHYNFYDPTCKAGACAALNEPPPRPWNPAIQPFPNGFRSQISRVTSLTDATLALNTSFQSILANTVWPNYELVSTQWPTDATSKIDPTGVPAPTFLANTTLETYTQGEVPQASSSCMDCHNNAADTTGRASDFTFILERAQ